MAELSEEALQERKIMARELLALHRTPLDDEKYVDFDLLPPLVTPLANLAIPFPAGLAPIPKPINPKPQTDAALPKSDIVVVTWTVDENDGLADVLTPGFNRNKWYRYDRDFASKYAGQSRHASPASNSRRLGSYFPTEVNGKKVLCFKSELHLNQDGIRNYNGTDQTSLPVRDLFKQIIKETRCKLILTVGTCGGIQTNHDLGDVLVTRAARFRCASEFDNAPFNHKTYTSDWKMKTNHFAAAKTLMDRYASNLTEPDFGPPTTRQTGTVWKLPTVWNPHIIHEKGTTTRDKMPAAHPILTTDYFEFGNSVNAADLWQEGCGVEMGDAVLGLVCTDDLSTNIPKWAVVRNLSDPQINGAITNKPSKLNMQAHWAVWYYATYGYWTSVMSSLTTWAIIVDN